MIDYRENNKWTVYIHISPSNKYYVGITSLENPQIRWRYGYGYKYNSHFWNAIKKYGWNNFQHEIFANHLTKDEACNMEITLIKLLKSNNNKYGYNKSSGGEYGRAGIKLSEETKEKIRQSNIGKRASEETKRKISENHADFSFGNNASALTTYQFDKNGKYIASFDSAKRASVMTGIDRHSISVACANNRMAGGYLWAHNDNVVYKDDTYHMKENNYYDKRDVKFNKEVYQFTPNGNFIAKYISTSDASRKTGIPRGTISTNARHKNNSKKYLWRYKEDVIESTENVGSFLLCKNKGDSG